MLDFERSLVALFELMEIEIGEQHDSHEFLVVLQEFVQGISAKAQTDSELLPAMCAVPTVQ